MPIDVLIVGDSHSRALQSGCDQLGLRTCVLTLSGTVWFEADLEYDPEAGLKSRKRKWVNENLGALSEKVGHSNFFLAGVPVLLSCMNMGRLSNVSRQAGHRYFADFDPAGDNLLPMSEAATQEYFRHQLRRQAEFLHQLGQSGSDTVVLTPPNLTQRTQPAAISRVYAEIVREAGLTCFDPHEHLPKGTVTLPDKFRHADNRHGNELYGKWVVDKLMEQGLLDMPVAA